MQTALLFIILSLALFAEADLTLRLSLGRINIAAASVGTKAIFAGGLVAPLIEGEVGIATDRVDIYDIETAIWVQANLSIARSSLISLTVGTNVLFCGGAEDTNVVDIYNSVTGEWSTKILSGTREYVKGTVVGTKAIIGGGRSLIGGILGISDLVEIYDSETEEWVVSGTTLLTARLSAAVTAIGDLALFIGGEAVSGAVLASIEVFNVVTELVTSVDLLVVRSELAAVGVGLKAIIAGGIDLDGNITGAVEIFNGTVSVLASLPLPTPRCQMQAVTDGVRAFFIGGLSALEPVAEVSAQIDIYNPEDDSWEVKVLAEARLNIACISVGLHVFVAGGGNYSDLCEVFGPEITPTPVETPTPGETPTPTPVIVTTPTRTPTPAVTPTPTRTPTPTPTPTPNNGLQCRLECLNVFEAARAALETSAHFRDQCACWTDYRQCVADCEGTTTEADVITNTCTNTQWIGELCDCAGNGGGKPASRRLIEILAEFRAIFLAYFNEIDGCDDAAWREALGVTLQFDFRFETDVTNLVDISVDLKALLGLYLNQDESRFIFSAESQKRAMVDGTLAVEVAEPDNTPQPGSAAGISISFVFFLVVALFHLF